MVSSLMILDNRLKFHQPGDKIASIFLIRAVPVKKADVLSDGSLAITLENGNNIDGKLSVPLTNAAKNMVSSLVKDGKNPKVILNQLENNQWVVSYYVTIKNKKNQELQVDLASWLKEKGYVY